MANISKAVAEVLDLVKHLVGTHVHWNMDLTKDEAIAKVEAARVALLAHDAEVAANAAAQGDVVDFVKDVPPVVADVKDLGSNPNV